VFKLVNSLNPLILDVDGSNQVTNVFKLN